MKRKLYQAIASKLQAMKNLENMDDVNGWYDKHAESIGGLIKEHFPHGSGFDGLIWLDFNNSTPQKLVFFAEYHHMNENGYYDGWSTLKIVVKPSLEWGFDFKITGIARKYRFDNEYFEDVVNSFLTMEV